MAASTESGPSEAVVELPCVNPFCDGYGNIDISPSINGRSWAPGACKVGPHPPMPSDYVSPRLRPCRHFTEQSS